MLAPDSAVSHYHDAILIMHVSCNMLAYELFCLYQKSCEMSF